MRTLLILLLATFASEVVAGPGRNCDAGSDFAGTVILSGYTHGAVELEWSTWEDGWTREYRLSRQPADCDKPACSTTVAKLEADTDTPTFQTHTLKDTAPPGIWVYQLELRRAHGDSCTLRTEEIVVPEPVCDTATLCSQLGQSLYGSVILGGQHAERVEIQWLTSAETPAVTGYRLSRYDCGGTDCLTVLGTLSANGSCGQPTLHGFVDTPPPGDWTWRLEVLGSAGRVLCSLDREVSP